MGRAAHKPSAAVGQLLRNRRLELNWSLRDVSERSGERGDAIPTSTLVRVEMGSLDPGVRRLHILLDLYDIPPHLVADVIEMEELAVDEPIEGELKVLFENGIDFLKRGHTAQALAHLFKIREFVAEDDESRILQQKAALAFASAAKDLGKFNLARKLVDDLLCLPPDPSILVRVMVLASGLWRGQGSVQTALAFIRQAATHIGNHDLQEKAWVLHQEATLLLETEDFDAASETIERTIKLYRKMKDTDGEARARVVQLEILEARGDLDAAIACARKVIRTAERHGNELPLISAQLELGRMLAHSGFIEMGIAELRKALSRSVLLENKLLEFHAHYHLWKAYETLGDPDRTRFELQSAGYFVKFIDPASPEAREVRQMLEGRGDGRPRRRRRRRVVRKPAS